MKRALQISLVLLVAIVFVHSAEAQTTTTNPVVYPQDNVGGGAIAKRRPGLRVSTSISKHVARMDSVLNNHGGADPQPRAANERHVLIVSALLGGLFAVAQELANALLLAAQAQALTT